MKPLPPERTLAELQVGSRWMVERQKEGKGRSRRGRRKAAEREDERYRSGGRNLPQSSLQAPQAPRAKGMHFGRRDNFASGRGRSPLGREPLSCSDLIPGLQASSVL